VALPGTSFIAGKPGQTYDPDLKGSYVKVNKSEVKDYQVNLDVTVAGYAGHSDMPFSDSCVKVTSGKSMVTVYPTTYQASSGDGDTRNGSMVFSAVFRGKYTFYPECNQDRSIHGVVLGSAGNVNKGVMHYQNTVVPVMGSRKDGHDLVVSVIPDEHGASQVCMRSSGMTARPSKVARTHTGDIVFTELTFKDMRRGTLYPTCSEKNHRVTVHGGGVKIQ